MCGVGGVIGAPEPAAGIIIGALEPATPVITGGGIIAPTGGGFAAEPLGIAGGGLVLVPPGITGPFGFVPPGLPAPMIGVVVVGGATVFAPPVSSPPVVEFEQPITAASTTPNVVPTKPWLFMAATSTVRVTTCPRSIDNGRAAQLPGHFTHWRH